MLQPGFMPRVWSQVASDLPNFAHDSWVAIGPSAWDSDPPPPTGPAYWCPCGAGFETLTRLRWHTNGVHPPGSQHPSSLGLLPRIGGSYVVYDPETRAVHLCGLARFPVSGGNKPSSTYAEACTIFLAMFHASRVLHPGHTYSTLTDSLSSVHGWDKSALPTTARASLSDKFSPIWLAVRTIVGRGDGLDHPSPPTDSRGRARCRPLPGGAKTRATASDPPEEPTLAPPRDAQGDTDVTATTDAPAALERVVLHGPPGAGMETPGDTPPRVPTTGGGDHGTSDTADDTTGDGDHGGGGTADNTTTGTGGGAEVNGAGAPSEDENHGPPAAVRSSTTTVDWQCTEHGRLWSDPLRWTPDVLLHRVVDTAANVATSSGRHVEGQFVSLFVVPPCSPPWVAEMAGSTYIAPAAAIRTAVDTHSASRLLRSLDDGVARLTSARGIKFTADGLVHLEATELLQAQTPSHAMDAGLRDALGRSACTLQNLVSVESPAVGDRIHMALTGSTTRSPLRCILCDEGAIDDNRHIKTCPATARHRSLRFLQMAEVMASIGGTMHHDPGLRPSVHARRDTDTRDLLSDVLVAPFHEHTPIHTLPQEPILSRSPDGARRFGVWKCSPGHKHTLRAVLLADRVHVIADLAWHFAPGVDISHVLAAAASHVHAHPGLYEYVRLTPPALLVWLAREFDLAGEAFSSPMTCLDTPSPRHSHFAQMPIFLRGVSDTPPTPNAEPGAV